MNYDPKEVSEAIIEMENDPSSCAFEDLFDADVLKRIRASYDEYLSDDANLSLDVLSFMYKDVSENEKLNCTKIMSNLGFSQAQIENQPSMVLANCASYQTVNLYLNTPEKITYNHKVALIAVDIYSDMHGDPEYPHNHFVSQFKEAFELFTGVNKVERADEFVTSFFEKIIPGYTQIYTEYLSRRILKS